MLYLSFLYPQIVPSSFHYFLPLFLHPLVAISSLSINPLIVPPSHDVSPLADYMTVWCALTYSDFILSYLNKTQLTQFNTTHVVHTAQHNSKGNVQVSCAASTKNDVLALIKDSTSNEDDPQKIVQAIEKGLQKELILFKTALVRVQL